MSRLQSRMTDVQVYSNPETYAGFPAMYRPRDELILKFGVQPRTLLKESGIHPHWGPHPIPHYAVSKDGGLTWRTSINPPETGPILEASHPMVMPNGELLSVGCRTHPQLQVHEGIRVTRSRGISGHNVVSTIDLGPSCYAPVRRMTPGPVLRTSEGWLLTGGEVLDPKPDTTAFLRGTPDGLSWGYVSQIEHIDLCDFSECSLVGFDDGRLVVMMRADWYDVPPEKWPVDADGNGMQRDGRGYFLYQAESLDQGITWTRPVRTGIWGHPPYLVRLRSGNVVMLYGHRRPPMSIRAILSRDECRTWDMNTMSTLHTFGHEGEVGRKIDLGYPVGMQLEDGSIVCAYYGYESDAVSEWPGSRGIFASVLDEAWLESGNGRSPDPSRFLTGTKGPVSPYEKDSGEWGEDNVL